jgi:hypothetical protein
MPLSKAKTFIAFAPLMNRLRNRQGWLEKSVGGTHIDSAMASSWRPLTESIPGILALQMTDN